MNQRDSKYRHENGRRGVPAALSGHARVGEGGLPRVPPPAPPWAIFPPPLRGSRRPRFIRMQEQRTNTTERYFWKISLVYSRSSPRIDFAGTLSDDLCESEAG